MKEGYVRKSPEADAGEMEKINRYTRREYRADEVYTFSLVLCDNEIDRDFERFSAGALEKLRELFRGKTCILDHERKSANQTARIYDTSLEPVEGRTTRDGEPYLRLTAKAYLPRTEKTAETVELIESGILKEVSVSCAVKRSVCSICGKESCSHQKGREYGGRICCRILEDPTDAYECSFVAVPAQREAGVRKGWREEDLEKRLAAAGAQGLRLSADDVCRLREELETLREKASWGEKYREELCRDVLKYSGLIQPEVPREIMRSAVEKLTVRELAGLSRAYGSMAGKQFPLTPQLAPVPEGETSRRNGEYLI